MTADNWAQALTTKMYRGPIELDVSIKYPHALDKDAACALAAGVLRDLAAQLEQATTHPASTRPPVAHLRSLTVPLRDDDPVDGEQD